MHFFSYRKLLRRTGEPQEIASGVPRGRTDDPAEEAETLRARGTAAVTQPPKTGPRKM
jgi:hypothetical protein